MEDIIKVPYLVTTNQLTFENLNPDATATFQGVPAKVKANRMVLKRLLVTGSAEIKIELFFKSRTEGVDIISIPFLTKIGKSVDLNPSNITPGEFSFGVNLDLNMSYFFEVKATNRIHAPFNIYCIITHEEV